MNIVSIFKSVLQPVVDAAVTVEKPQAEALAATVGAKVEAAIETAVTKHVDAPTAALIMAEVDAQLNTIEAEVNTDIENFRVKL